MSDGNWLPQQVKGSALVEYKRLPRKVRGNLDPEKLAQFMDHWEEYRAQGYGTLVPPTMPGTITIRVPAEFFLPIWGEGGSPKQNG